MSTSDAVSKFEKFIAAHKDDFESVDVRVVGLKHGGNLLCVAGRAILMDQPVGVVERYADIFTSEDVVLLQDVLPMDRLPELVQQIGDGTAMVHGQSLRLRERQEERANVQFQESSSFWLGPGANMVGASIRWWANDELQKILEYDIRSALDRRLGGYGKGYKDLTDLVVSFIPGHELTPGSRPEFQILAPTNIDARGRFHEKSVELVIDVGRRIKREKLRFVAILRDQFNTKYSTRRTTFKVLPKGWKPTATGFRARNVIPRGDERACELLMVYGGQTVRTHFEGLYDPNLPESPSEQEGTEPPLKPGQTDELVLLAADFAGSTKLKENLGEDAAKPLLDDWESHVRGVVPIYRGYVMSWAGDGGLACFWGEGKHENALAAALHVLYYAVARHTRPIVGMDMVRVRLALHSGLIKWQRDTGSIKSHDIDVVRHAEGGLEPVNSIAASQTFLKKLPARLRGHFKPYRKVEDEKFYRTDLSIFSSTLTPRCRK